MAETDRRKIQGEVSLDASGVREGAQEAIKATKDMAAGMEQAGKQAGRAFEPTQKGANTTAQAMSRAEKSMVASIERATAALKSGGKQGAEYYEILAKQRGISGDVLAPYIKQLREAEAAQKSLNRANMAMSDKQIAAAMRGVPAQFTDILVSLQGGQNPMTVLFQQGGQLKDMFGGVGAAARALGGYILGLVNPFTLAAGAVGVLSLAYYQGSKEADAYAKAIIMTGNAAGTTVGQLAAMAQELDGKGFTESAAAAALAQVAASGNVARDSIAKVAEVALRLEKDAGIPIADTVKAFDELGKSPVEASLKLTEQYRYLTAEVYQQIKALEDEGRTVEAAKVAQEAYHDAMTGRTQQLQERLGHLERVWRGLGSAAAWAWSAMLGVGREKTLDQKIAEQQEIVARAEKVLAGGGFESNGGGAAFGRGGTSNAIAKQRLEEAQALLKTLTAQKSAEDQAAKSQADAQQRESARTKWLRDGEKYLDKSAKLEMALTKARNEGKAAGASQAEIEARLTKIREEFAEKGGKGPSTNAASRRLDLSGIQSAMRHELALIGQQQQALELQRAAGLVSEQDYHTQKRALIEQSGRAEQKALQEQIERLEAEKSKGADAINAKRQLGEVRMQLALKQVELQNKLAKADDEAAAAMQRQAQAMQSLTEAHQRYLAQLNVQAQRSTSTAWMGDKERSRLQGQWAIEDRYTNERNRIEGLLRDPRLSPDAKQQHEYELSLLKEKQERELQVYAETYQKLDALQANWANGAAQAMQNYADQAANVAGQVGNAFTKAFQGMEDAIVNFAMTGKLSFSDMAKSIIADLIRIQARQAIVGIAGSLFGQGGSLAAAGKFFGFASGGYTGDGGKYEPAGIVHKGEYVINAASTKKLGLAYLSRLNGYANGGLVGGGGAAAPVGGVMKVEIINNGEPMRVQSSGIEAGVLKVVVEQAAALAAPMAVRTAASQVAGRHGDMHQALLQRERF